MTAQMLERHIETDRLSCPAPGNDIIRRRAIECVAMCMIGDGALCFVEPNRHIELWTQGPKMWQQLVRPFAERPQLTRWLGAASVALGFWLASRQEP